MNPNQFSKTTIISLVFCLIAGFFLGAVFFGRGGENQSLKSENERLQAQLEKAKKFFPPILELQNVSGTIKKVEGNVVTMETGVFSNPFEELPQVREVTVIVNTKIIRNEPKDWIEFQKEVQDYQKKLEKSQKQSSASLGTPPAAGIIPPPPNPFKEIAIKISDLKAGDIIFVDAGKNIKSETRFEAIRIVVTVSPTLPSSNAPKTPPALSP